MPIMTSCSKCGRQIAAPDTAAGKRARCPECGAVVQIPESGEAAPAAPAAPRAGRDVAREAAAALAAYAPPAGGAARPASAPKAPPVAAAEPEPEEPPHTSATTIDRIAARTSPYGTIRLLAAIIFALGVIVGILVFVGGLVALVFLAMANQPLSGVGAFAGALITALLTVLWAKAGNELLRLAADIGDRSRLMTGYLEDLANRR